MRMERGEPRDQMIVDRDSEADWKQEGHFSGGLVGKTLPFNSGGRGVGQAQFRVGELTSHMPPGQKTS